MMIMIVIVWIYNYILYIRVLQSGFLGPITDHQSLEAVSADPITDNRSHGLFEALYLLYSII